MKKGIIAVTIFIIACVLFAAMTLSGSSLGELRESIDDFFGSSSDSSDSSDTNVSTNPSSTSNVGNSGNTSTTASSSVSQVKDTDHSALAVGGTGYLTLDGRTYFYQKISVPSSSSGSYYFEDLKYPASCSAVEYFNVSVLVTDGVTFNSASKNSESPNNVSIGGSYVLLTYGYVVDCDDPEGVLSTLNTEIFNNSSVWNVTPMNLDDVGESEGPSAG